MPLVELTIRGGNYGYFLSQDELFAAGTLGVARGLATFDPGKGKTLENWLRFTANAQIMDDVRIASRNRRAGVSSSSDFEDERDGPQEEAIRKEERAVFDSAFAKLDERSRRVLVAIGTYGKKQREVAESEGVSQSWISRVYRRAVAAIRAEAERATR